MQSQPAHKLQRRCKTEHGDSGEQYQYRCDAGMGYLRSDDESAPTPTFHDHPSVKSQQQTWQHRERTS